MKTYLLHILLLILLIGCNEEENGKLTPSYADIDWFLITDSPNEIDHLRYEIFKNMNISVYYSDTIGKQYRGLDGYGDSVIHHETLTPYYSIGSATNNISYILSYNEKAIRNGILFLTNSVIPALVPEAYPRSILLVENLTLRATSSVSSGKREGNVYRGVATTIVSKINTLDTISTKNKHNLAMDIAAPLWYRHLNRTYKDELNTFYSVSDHSVTWALNAKFTSAYERMAWSTKPPTDVNYIPYRTHWNAYGFLISDPNQPGNLGGGPSVYTTYNTPTKEQDVTSFIEAVLKYSETEFANMYKEKEGLDFLIEKYRIIKALLDESRNNH